MEQAQPDNGQTERSDDVPSHCIPLGVTSRGFCGQIWAIRVAQDVKGLPTVELERRLLELGFIEGADVAVLHEGPVARDPLAVRVNGATIALRRREAMAILVIPSESSA
jgi:ferrous iron transport protein A